jgi:hypothetical protein
LRSITNGSPEARISVSGLLVLSPQSGGGRVAVDEAGVRNQPDARLDRGVHGVGHLGIAPSEVSRRDEQQLVGAGERRHQGGGPVVVSLTDLHATLGEVGRLLWVAHGGHDLASGHTRPCSASTTSRP